MLTTNLMYRYLVPVFCSGHGDTEIRQKGYGADKEERQVENRVPGYDYQVFDCVKTISFRRGLGCSSLAAYFCLEKKKN